MLLELLGDNYRGYAQMVNLICEWHQFLGDDEKEVQKEVRSHLKVSEHARRSQYPVLTQRILATRA